MNWIKNGTGLMVALVSWCFLGLSAGHAEIDPQKERDIRKLLRVSGIYQQLDYMKDGVLDAYGTMIASSYPKVPDAFWKEYYGLVGDEEMKDLIDRVVPVYDSHMSHEVIKKLIGMFENPFWEEWKQKMPIISREAGLAGNEWSHELVKSDAFRNQVDALIGKYKLETLNSNKTPPPASME
ncbi:exported hypothetical protein [Nitrospina gracilis 3/211]|uniref:DUF2059 domain-containing protein n=1 Tax=Nitrospina gracilis (strain 3/211) TaxID=1266370 RepID=M1YY94_NITG3|nr:MULTISPECIES: DUF2059 domain-containing protein [Nitrospina]MCF8723574.1 hypothetical protein [Nitrospina sp. Nb-3]CCQ90648.1 exported hypothetical protein [Nitrospina gracilis 3/211]